MKKNYCINCGKFGHSNKKCSEPKTSLGIICFKFDPDLNINYNFLVNSLSNNYTSIDDFNFENLNCLTKINYFKNKIKFLLIKRKHSLNYIEFIRGKYDLNDVNKISKMISLMSPKELENLNSLSFDKLWENLWKKTSKSKIYQKEYKNSKKKFNKLLKKEYFIDLINSKPKYNDTEWGLPKGRRNNFEKNIDCALREFLEETNFNLSDFSLLNNIFSVQENYLGTNNVHYKHIYYIGISKSDNQIEYLDNDETSDIKWFNWEDAINIIRPYYESKIEVLNKVFLFAINLYLQNINNQQLLY